MIKMIKTEPIELMGAPGSPYTRKMLAVLRFRGLPYRFKLSNDTILEKRPRPKVSLLPTFYLPNEQGDMEAVIDSTPIIQRLDAEHPERRLLPQNPVLRFLDLLLEDYGDEWLTKAMFHYRWWYKGDISQARQVLPRWTLQPRSEKVLDEMGDFIARRQIGRLGVVGSNRKTAKFIEKSYEDLLGALVAHLEQQPFLLGARPGASDFAFFGQLTQLAMFDPTPMALTLKRAPRVYAWVQMLEDLSGLDVDDDKWNMASALPPTLINLLRLVGETYVPVMVANARAASKGKRSFSVKIGTRVWKQNTFPYQARCVEVLREHYVNLDPESQGVVHDVLKSTQCWDIIAADI